MFRKRFILPALLMVLGTGFPALAVAVGGAPGGTSGGAAVGTGVGIGQTGVGASTASPGTSGPTSADTNVNMETGAGVGLDKNGAALNGDAKVNNNAAVNHQASTRHHHRYHNTSSGADANVGTSNSTDANSNSGY